MNPRRHLIRTLATTSLLALTVLTGCTDSKPQFKAIDITGADYAKDFSLTDQHGKLRSLADFKGKVVVVFFGFVQCPEVCPTTMAELAAVKKQLGADGDKFQALFITVDPERDTPEVLKAYMINFDPSFLALYAPPERLAVLAKDFKVHYKKTAGTSPGSYSMDHSAGSYVYDPQGNLRLYTRYGSGVQALVDDIRLLFKH